jgi:uncharacterized delta-60 repeat protein
MRAWYAPIFALCALVLVLVPGLAKAAPGDLDPSFGRRGKVTTSITGDDEINAMALQEDGKIVVAGYASGPNNADLALARYLPDGDLDPSFGDHGILKDDLGGGDGASAVAIQSDGKIVVAGISDHTRVAESDYNFTVLRYEPDGSRDRTFNQTGEISIGFAEGSGDFARALAVQKNGRILVAGWTNAGGAADIAVVRLQQTGKLDPSFGNNGMVQINLGPGASGEGATAMALQRDGKILLAGGSINGDSLVGIAVVRLTRRGRLDPTFGNDGVAVFRQPDRGNDGYGLTIQKNGKILVAGESIRDSSSYDSSLMLVRFNSNGTLDTSFGESGVVLTDFGGNASWAKAVVEFDGKIVAAGYAQDINHSDFAVSRYDLRGRPDPEFGIDGRVMTDFKYHGIDWANALQIQGNGRIILAGRAYLGNLRFGFAMAGYEW